MKCVILGGGGFIGAAIADHLLLEGYELRVFERPRVEPYRKFKADERVEWVTGDFLNSYDISHAIDGMDIVLHLVSTTLPKNSNDDPIYDVQTNLVGTLQLLNAMIKHKVRKMVFISSGGTVYGKPHYLPIDENHPTNPLVSYGITKLAIEKYLQMFESLYGIKAIILRVSNPYGERQRTETAQGAVGVFLQCAINDIPIDIWGDGSIKRDYLYVNDVAHAFVQAINYSGSHCVFNISSGLGTSLNELIELLENILDKSIKCRYLPARPFDVPVNVLNNKLAREELQWTPKMEIPEGIARTALWLKSRV